jgi:hypothetical protein
MFTVRYALSPYIKQTLLVFKGLSTTDDMSEHEICMAEIRNTYKILV